MKLQLACDRVAPVKRLGPRLSGRGPQI